MFLLWHQNKFESLAWNVIKKEVTDPGDILSGRFPFHLVALHLGVNVVEFLAVVFELSFELLFFPAPRSRCPFTQFAGAEPLWTDRQRRSGRSTGQVTAATRHFLLPRLRQLQTPTHFSLTQGQCVLYYTTRNLGGGESFAYSYGVITSWTLLGTKIEEVDTKTVTGRLTDSNQTFSNVILPLLKKLLWSLL